MRCIDADALIEYLQIIPIDLGYREVDDIEKYVRSMPTIEPRCETCEAFNKTRLLIPQPERKKGKWIYLDKDKRFFHPHIVECSVCNNSLDMYGVNAGRGDANFCPNCGADMREDGEAE